MRADLLQLGPDGLAALASPGLVRRARGALDAGEGPALEEDAGGTVTGAFADGARTRLPPGTSLRAAPCSCGAAEVCRHRVALVLAYADRAGPAAVAAAVAAGGSPADVDDAALARAVGRRGLARARRAGPLVAVVRRGGAAEAPRVTLPTCAVRFLVPADPTWARCGCAAGGGCEHVALAVWAFRAAAAAGLAAPGAAGEAEVTVELRSGEAPAGAGPAGAGPAGAAALPPGLAAALADAEALARDVVLEGVVAAPPALAQRFRRAARGLARAGAAWPLTLVRDLEAALAAYRDRAAGYRPASVVALVVGLAARARAARGGGALPPAFVLGLGEAGETPLDRARLVSLGARVEADGDARRVTVLLADPAGGEVLSLERAFAFAPGAAPDGPALAGRSVAPGCALGALAHGQVVTRAARRGADRRLVLGAPRGAARTAVTPQAGEAWGALPPPVRVADLAAHEAHLRTRPPRCLRPRHRAEDVHVVALAEVGAATWAPGEQVLAAPARDPAGRALRLELTHRPGAPGALDAAAAELARARPRFASGTLRVAPGGLVLEVAGLVTDRVFVPDLAPAPATTGAAPLAALADDLADPRGPAGDPVAAALAAAEAEVEALAHHGLRRPPPGAAGRLRAAGARLAAVGLEALAARARALADALASREDDDARAGAWVALALDLALAVELAAAGGGGPA